jgi:hypothetical protein
MKRLVYSGIKCCNDIKMKGNRQSNTKMEVSQKFVKGEHVLK